MDNDPPPPARSLKRWNILAVGQWLLMLVAFHVPIPGQVEEQIGLPPRSDKTIHLVLYGAFGLVLSGAFDAGCRRRNRAIPAIAQAALMMAVLAVYGYVDELTQPWTGRRYDLGDFAADILGAAAGIVMFHLFRAIGLLGRVGLEA